MASEQLSPWTLFSCCFALAAEFSAFNQWIFVDRRGRRYPSYFTLLLATLYAILEVISVCIIARIFPIPFPNVHNSSDLNGHVVAGVTMICVQWPIGFHFMMLTGWWESKRVFDRVGPDEQHRLKTSTHEEHKPNQARSEVLVELLMTIFPMFGAALSNTLMLWMLIHLNHRSLTASPWAKAYACCFALISRFNDGLAGSCTNRPYFIGSNRDKGKFKAELSRLGWMISLRALFRVVAGLGPLGLFGTFLSETGFSPFPPLI